MHDHAPDVCSVPYSPGGWFIPLATTQRTPSAQGTLQPDNCIAGMVVVVCITSSLAGGGATVVVVGCDCSAGSLVGVGAAVVVVVVVVVEVAVGVSAAVVVVVVEVDVGSAVVVVVVVGPLPVAKVVVVVVVVDEEVGVPSVAGSLPAAVVVVVVEEEVGVFVPSPGSPVSGCVSSVAGDVSEGSAPVSEAAKTWSAESLESPSCAIPHPPSPPTISPITRKMLLASKNMLLIAYFHYSSASQRQRSFSCS